MLQRDLNKIISLLLSQQWRKQNPSEKRQTKYVRKCVGNEVRPLHEDPEQLEYYERIPEPSFTAADCLPFLFFFFFFTQLGPPEVWRKVTYSMLEWMAVVPGPRVFCSKSINAGFRRFLTILCKGNVLENLKSTYQAFYKLEKYYTIRTLKKISDVLE